MRVALAIQVHGIDHQEDDDGRDQHRKQVEKQPYPGVAFGGYREQGQKNRYPGENEQSEYLAQNRSGLLGAD